VSYFLFMGMDGQCMGEWFHCLFMYYKLFLKVGPGAAQLFHDLYNVNDRIL